MSDQRSFNSVRATRWTLVLTLGLTLGLGVVLYAPLTQSGMARPQSALVAPEQNTAPGIFEDPSNAQAQSPWSEHAPSLSDQPQAPSIGRTRGS